MIVYDGTTDRFFVGGPPSAYPLAWRILTHPVVRVGSPCVMAVHALCKRAMGVHRGFVRITSSVMVRRSAVIHIKATRFRGVELALANGHRIPIAKTSEARDAVRAILGSSSAAIELVPLSEEEKEAINEEQLELVNFRY